MRPAWGGGGVQGGEDRYTPCSPGQWPAAFLLLLLGLPPASNKTLDEIPSGSPGSDCTGRGEPGEALAPAGDFGASPAALDGGISCGSGGARCCRAPPRGRARQDPSLGCGDNGGSARTRRPVRVPALKPLPAGSAFLFSGAKIAAAAHMPLIALKSPK